MTIKTRTILALAALAVCWGLGACTVDDDDAAMAADGGNMTSDGSVRLLYTVRWTYFSFNSSYTAVSGAAGDPVLMQLQPAMGQLSISYMPCRPFLALVGLEHCTVGVQQPYTLTYYEKGFSRNTRIYGLTMPDFVFTCREGDTTHQVRVVFNAAESELAVDAYLNTLQLYVVLEEVQVDGRQASALPDLLIFQ